MKKTVEVLFIVEVEVDEAAFDEVFMTEFRQGMYDFRSIDDHIKHLAQLTAREFIEHDNQFLEGYGILSTMGIKTKVIDQEEEIVS